MDQAILEGIKTILKVALLEAMRAGMTPEQIKELLAEEELKFNAYDPANLEGGR